MTRPLATERHRSILSDRTDVGLVAWMDDGACRDEDPDLFFPLSSKSDQTDEAISVCHGCGVQAECLLYALRLPVQYGVWGGHTERQRIRMLRKARRTHVETPPDH